MIFKTEEEDTARWSLRIDDDGDLEILVNDIRVLFIGSYWSRGVRLAQ